jgi:hypothetical protein
MEHAGGSAHTRPDDGDAPENVIRITASGKERHYISYANGLLLEKGARPVQVWGWNEKGRRGGERERKRERGGRG